ncbi:hypothetical protein XENTR_v10000371 [Xenopus tropicalis]|uniref:Transmembrane protein 128 isoform X1 n=1 Tax=Xenopus tropicalis TaxID=8364 RepID=A0A803JNR5_XENTR|nr:transmembrane protein 128 isoform X1 [Xenopus tropicalis]XP_031751197.1 transmembrane protein 128 isoform X1 [Xenopus tropicalis]XP_031751198.1 transmembrane protein 128 isoform X1 [Xenopus tropicalis]KAE8629148.1 hypothetical protein XENTR_v10000371 [Xenopus tropicalis]
MASLLEEKDLRVLRQRFQRQAESLLQGTENEDSDEKKKKEKPLPRVNLHSVFWILAAVALTYYIDFFEVVKEILQGGCMWLLTGTILLAISLSIALYCMVYLEWYCRISDYDNQYPALVPVTVAVFVTAAVWIVNRILVSTGWYSYNVALWPVWSFFTPFILFTQFMGVVMLVSLLG